MDEATRAFLDHGSVPGGHVALLVRDDRFLVATVAGWALGSLKEGGGALLIGTPVHLEQIREAMSRSGCDLGAAERAGSVVVIDADWLMAKFMIDGSPDGRAFRGLLDEILGRMTGCVGSPTRIRAWGEMVALLRLRHNAKAATRLEALWEAALQAHGFALLCSYQTDHPAETPSIELVRDVAHTHTSWYPQPFARATVVAVEAGPAVQPVVNALEK